MDIYFSKPLTQFVLMQVVLLRVAFVARPSAGNLLPQVCSKTPDPVFCLNVLGSRAKTSNKSELERLAIDVASFHAFEIKAKIRSLFVSAQDSRLKIIYSRCNDHYTRALEGLRAAKASALNAANARKGGVAVSANAVSGHALQCEKSFSASVPPRKSTLSVDNQVVGLLVNIIDVIATMSK